MGAQTPAQAPPSHWHGTMAEFDAEVRRRWIESSERLGLDHGMPNAAAVLAAQEPHAVPELAATPGQAAYETVYGDVGLLSGMWHDLEPFQRERWEAAAQAAIDVFLAGDSVSAESIREVLAIDPAKLDILADWFDADDLAKGRSGRTEVQADLRRWAKLVRDARAGLMS